MRIAALLVALGAVGCGNYNPVGDAETKPRQLEAQQIAWSALGMTSEPSRIYWVQGDRLDCADGKGWTGPGGYCVGGLTWDEFDWSDVAWWPGSTFSDEPVDDPAQCDRCMVHEMAHVAAWLRYGDGSGRHRDELFAHGGLVDKANGALLSAGL